MSEQSDRRREEARERRKGLRAVPPGEKKQAMKELHRVISRAEHIMDEVERVNRESNEADGES